MEIHTAKRIITTCSAHAVLTATAPYWTYVYQLEFHLWFLLNNWILISYLEMCHSSRQDMAHRTFLLCTMWTAIRRRWFPWSKFNFWYKKNWRWYSSYILTLFEIICSVMVNHIVATTISICSHQNAADATVPSWKTIFQHWMLNGTPTALFAG